MSEKNPWLYITTSLDEDEKKFSIEQMEGTERISGLFSYRLKLHSYDNAVCFSDIVDNNITIVIKRYDGSERFINGIVSRFVQSDHDGNVTTYFADIRPWFYKLTLVFDSRIFQDMSAPEIATKIFRDYGFDDFEDNTVGTYNNREYCVWYQETAFNFISRLLEEEGIFYFFKHENGKHILNLVDDKDVHEFCDGMDTALKRKFEPYNDYTIETCSFEQRIVPSKYYVDDFNFETPAIDLMTSADGEVDGNLKIYEYPGKFTQTQTGEKIAGKRIEARELLWKTLKGSGSCRSFIAGYKFNLKNHERSDFNATYVIKLLSIKCDQNRYTNNFEAFPEDIPYRPLPLTKKTKITGTQTALVVGEKGEEIWPDKYGRVKVQFHWDQEGKNDENSSCWIRVAQGWAGKGWGSIFIPRVGTEVIVSFINGDPDCPLIIGTVYNAENKIPYPLPENKNISTILSISTKEGEAGNELYFDDTKDSELLRIHAQKDMNSKIENDYVKHVVNTRQVFIQKDDPELLEGMKELLEVEGDRKTLIKGASTKELHVNEGEFTQEVTKNFTLKVDGKTLLIEAAGDLIIRGKSITIESTQKDIEIKSSADLKMNADKNINSEAKLNVTTKAKMDLKNEAKLNLSNKAGIELKNEASAMATVDGGGMLTLKGGLVKIN